jgi:hypothetical protein
MAEMDSTVKAIYDAIGTPGALVQAQEAVSGATSKGDKKLEAQATEALATVYMSKTEPELAIKAATKAVETAKASGDKATEASAKLTLANAYVASIGKGMGKCSLASAQDSIEALKAGKEAHALFGEVGGSDGMMEVMRTIGLVLMYNQVSPELIESASDPEQVYQDVMSGRYSHSKNALPPAPQPKQLKLEEAVPSSLQLSRGKFPWRNALEGYSFTLIWQPCRDRGTFQGGRDHGSYDIVALNTGCKSMSMPALYGTRCSDQSNRDDSLVVHMTSVDTGPHYGADMMSCMNTIAAMVVARLSKLTLVQMGEHFSDWQDIRNRPVHMYPVTLSILRSARLEAPNISIGFVAGDAPSWLQDPAPLIENMFDTVEELESEVIYRKGDPYAPLLVHRPLDEPVQYVKPKRGASWIGRN